MNDPVLPGRVILNEQSDTSLIVHLEAFMSNPLHADQPDVTAFICVDCGTQFPPSAEPPSSCPICEDDREYLNQELGQQWTSLPELIGTHHNRFDPVEPGVTRIATEPRFGIGQQAYLIETSHGNILWDLVGFVDETTIAEIQRRGGVVAIAISHPHFYTTMIVWSRALGNVPILLHESNRTWVMRPDAAVQFWSGDTISPVPGINIIRTGGHFPGGSVLHWDNARHDADRKGVLFSGDTVMVVADPHWVTFMYSYPNDIPLDATTVRRIASFVAPFTYDRIHDAFDKHVREDGNGTVERSAERYIRHLEGRAGPTI